MAVRLRVDLASAQWALITSGFVIICDAGAITPFTPSLVIVCVAGSLKSSFQTRSLALSSWAWFARRLATLSAGFEPASASVFARSGEADRAQLQRREHLLMGRLERGGRTQAQSRVVVLLLLRPTIARASSGASRA